MPNLAFIIHDYYFFAMRSEVDKFACTAQHLQHNCNLSNILIMLSIMPSKYLILIIPLSYCEQGEIRALIFIIFLIYCCR
jgi:hypothetical protein